MNKTYGGLVSNPVNKKEIVVKNNVTYTFDGSVIENTPDIPQEDTSNAHQENQQQGQNTQHEYVEIGGIKWATMNIGANSITDGGLYFLWGDTQGYTAEQVGEGDGKKYFDVEGYKYAELDTSGGDGGSGSGGGTSYNMTKYNWEDGLITLQLSDDAVNAAWGGNWRMPTIEEFQTLIDATTQSWTDDYQGSGITGCVYTDKTDSSKVLFFPVCGFANYNSVYDNNGNGLYFSNSLEEVTPTYACILSFGNGSTDSGTIFRYAGCSVRGILDE